MTDGWTGLTPVLDVANAEASIQFYCDLLGFNEDWIHRFEADLPAYACVSRGPLILHLSEIGGTQIAKLFVQAPDVDAVYNEFRTSGLKTEPPQSVPEIRLRRFNFDDRDGHNITFASELRELGADA
jgi:catechol 2,3-dioxygenase-like lactoylglutathione lyase family enzyme